MTVIIRPPVRDTQGPRVTTVENPEPVRDSRRPERNLLMRHIHHHGGYPVTITITAGVVEEWSIVRNEVMNAADFVAVGGHDTPVTAAQQALLEAAGYGPYLLGS